MRWCRPGAVACLDEVLERLARAAWPAPPPGFRLVGKPRAMRRVLAGRAAGVDVVVKWSRPVTLTDRVRRWVGGKGVREGQVLRALGEADVPCAPVLAYADEGEDVLVTEWLSGLVPLPPLDAVTRGIVEDTGRLLGRAFAAGLRHRDLHRENVVLYEGRPLFLDVGRARIRQEGGRVLELARACHGLAGDLPGTLRLRAVRAWLRGAGVELDRSDLRQLLEDVETRAAQVARRYRRGRDRRATRSGRHFVMENDVHGRTTIHVRSVRPALVEASAGWLTDDPPKAHALKEGGRVLRLEHPDGTLVLKRYGAVAPGRLPRPLRAFRHGWALKHRGVDTPTPLLAVAEGQRGGFVLTEWMPGDNLLAFTDGGRGGALAELSPHRRRRWLAALGRFLRQMHDAEVRHRDLKAPNLLVVDVEAGRFAIADVEGARVNGRPVSWARRTRDLARLDASLDALASDRMRVFRAYLHTGRAPPVPRRRLLGRIARWVARKRGPTGAPR